MKFGSIDSLGQFKYDGLVKVADAEITDSYTKLLLNGNSTPDGFFGFHSDGESTHTIVYLDYANMKIRSGNETLWSDDCSSLTGWVAYGNKGAAVSQVTFDSKSCLKFDAGSSQTHAGIVSGALKGSYYNNAPKNVGTGKYSVEFSYYGDVVGGYGSYFDGFQLSIGWDNIYIGLTIWDGGFNCWNGSSHVSLGDPFLPDVWQTWRIEVNVPTNTANFYLNNVLTFTGVTLAVGTYNNPWYASTGQNPVFYNHACCTQDQYKFGDGCLVFDGTDDYISLADSDDWSFGSGDFTIDTWVKFHDITASNIKMIIAQWNTAPTMGWWLGAYDNDLYFYYTTDGSTPIAKNVDWIPVVDTWYHIAAVRNGANFYFFVNGQQIGATQSLSGVTIYNPATLLTVGASLSVGAGANFLNGWMDEVRVSKGIARWTSNFDVATDTYPINYETNSLLISSSLNGDVDGEYILESRIVAGNNSAQNAYGVTMNNDTGSYNYPRQALSGNNSTIAAGRTCWTQSMYICANGMAATKVSYSRVLICPKSGYKRIGFSEQTNNISGTTVTEVRLEGAGYINAFSSAANITGLTVVSPGGGIGYGSRFTLWKKEYHT